jgi:hypothetical protein
MGGIALATEVSTPVDPDVRALQRVALEVIKHAVLNAYGLGLAGLRPRAAAEAKADALAFLSTENDALDAFCVAAGVSMRRVVTSFRSGRLSPASWPTYSAGVNL